MSSTFVSFLRRKITFMQFMLSKEFSFPFYPTNCHHLLNIEATGSSDFWSIDAVTLLLCFPYFVNALEAWATPPWHCTLPESLDLCGTWYLLLTLSACQTKAQKLSRRKYSDIFVTTKEGIQKVRLVGHHGRTSTPYESKSSERMILLPSESYQFRDTAPLLYRILDRSTTQSSLIPSVR